MRLRFAVYQQHPIPLKVTANPSQSILSSGWSHWEPGWAQLYGRATAHYEDASYSTHAPLGFAPCHCATLSGPGFGSWQEPMISCSHRSKWEICSQVPSQLQNLHRIALLEFLYPDLSLSLVLLLLPRNLVAIKSSLPQFLNQNLAPA